MSEIFHRFTIGGWKATKPSAAWKISEHAQEPPWCGKC